MTPKDKTQIKIAVAVVVVLVSMALCWVCSSFIPIPGLTSPAPTAEVAAPTAEAAAPTAEVAAPPEEVVTLPTDDEWTDEPTPTTTPATWEETPVAGEGTATPTPTSLPSPVATRLGEMKVEYPSTMIQGTTARWLVEMYIPQEFASLELPPVPLEFQPDSPEPPKDGSEYSTKQVKLKLSRYMQVQLVVPPGFTLDGPPPTIWKYIDLNDSWPYMSWEWQLTAPDKPGNYSIRLSVYWSEFAPTTGNDLSIDPRQPARRPLQYTIIVVPYTPTPTFAPTPTPVPPIATATPTITPTPTPVPFIDPGIAATGIGALTSIVVALIGLVGVFVARDRIPPFTKGQKRRSLEKQIVEKTRRLELLKEQSARHGDDTDPAIIIEIEDLEAEIPPLEQELKALE